MAIDMEDGVLLKPKTPFPATTLSETAACLAYSDKAKTLAEMDAAIAHGIKQSLSQ